jgi:F0F1-type ATP synthase assembly protein I
VSRHIRGPMRSAGLVGGLGFTLGLMTAAGAGVGYYLDQRWGTVPWLTLAGTLCGMGAGFFEVVSVIRRLGDGGTRGVRRR